jgi:hypothetical protein
MSNQPATVEVTFQSGSLPWLERCSAAQEGLCPAVLLLSVQERWIEMKILISSVQCEIITPCKTGIIHYVMTSGVGAGQGEYLRQGSLTGWMMQPLLCSQAASRINQKSVRARSQRRLNFGRAGRHQPK